MRKQHLASHPQCELCGTTEHLNVHHINPYHLNPDKELDPENLITLCEASPSPALRGLNCHLWAGHLGNWDAFNPRVRQVTAKLGTIVQESEPALTQHGRE